MLNPLHSTLDRTPGFTPWKVATFLMVLLLASTCVAVLSQRGALLTGLALPVLLTIILVPWVTRPMLFLAIGTSLYLLTQGHLVGISVLFERVNAAQFAAMTLLGLVSARILLRFLTRSSTRPHIPSFAVPFLLFLSTTLLAWFLAPPFVAGEATAKTVRLLSCLLMLLAGYAFSSKTSDFRLLTLFVVFVALFQVGPLLHHWLNPTDVTHRITVGAQRLTGSLSGYNQTAALALLAVPVLWAMLSSNPSRLNSWGMRLGLALVAIALFLTFRRAAILHLFLFVLITILRSLTTHTELQHRRRALALLFLTCAVVVLGGSIVGPDAIAHRIADIPFLGQTDLDDPTAGSNRIGIWTAVLSDLGNANLRQWLFGHGALATMLPTQRRLGLPLLAHNSYIQLLYDQGILGLSAFLWLIYILFRSALATFHTNPTLTPYRTAISSFLLAYLATQFLVGNAIYDIHAEWYLYAMLGSLCNPSLDNHETTHPAYCGS